MYDPNDAKHIVWAFFDVTTGLETCLTHLKPHLILVLIVLPLIPSSSFVVPTIVFGLGCVEVVVYVSVFGWWRL